MSEEDKPLVAGWPQKTSGHFLPGKVDITVTHTNHKGEKTTLRVHQMVLDTTESSEFNTGEEPPKGLADPTLSLSKQSISAKLMLEGRLLGNEDGSVYDIKLESEED